MLNYLNHQHIQDQKLSSVAEECLLLLDSHSQVSVTYRTTKSDLAKFSVNDDIQSKFTVVSVKEIY